MDEQDPTKVRLLEAAGREFAARGYEAATVRAICDRAAANVAAVNYHFGGKEALYERAVVEPHRCGIEEPSPDDEALEGMAPELRLRACIGHFLRHVFAVGTLSWHHELMLRELVHPTAASDALVREAIRPKFTRLAAVLRDLEPKADQRRLDAMVFSVVGQCIAYRICRPFQERLIGPERLARLDAEYLTDHITGVMLAAIRGPDASPRDEVPR